ncbi:hypothetical protein JAAARDRAFT_208325 [Jaapia argillacea MUCL 33604]|uniref:F-box domain-containing protein n=1 Tax=Jaapia argillacea MUCL 33604 TaxID=933084 RepID=A0A067Q0I1_9AGAM|nr:hypothetical protein JAAARDRAFT_208325 [Jaapia argillacea MUCL 33604]
MFDSFPIELLTAVLSGIDFRSLLVCRQLSHRFRAIIDATPSLQYTIELAIAGMVDNPKRSMPIEERRRRLMVYQENWANTSWKREEILPGLEKDLWELNGDVMFVMGHPDTLSLHQLPGISCGLQGSVWTIEGVGPEVLDFKIDASQDLLVGLEILHHQSADAEEARLFDGCYCRIHTRSLSTGAPHPKGLAVGHFLDGPLMCTHDDMWFDIHISGDLLAFGYCDNLELSVWKWKLGAFVTYLEPQVNTKIDTFTFLGDDALLLASVSGDRAGLQVCSLSGPRGNKILVNPHYLYPPLSDGAYASLEIKYDSSGSPSPTYPNESQAPFYSSPESRILAVGVQLTNNGEEVHWFHVIPVSVFLHAARHPQSIEDQNGFVAWDDWGPEKTCLVTGQPPFLFGSSVSGTRLVTLVPVHNDVGQLQPAIEVSVYDFNSFAIRRDRTNGRGSDIFETNAVFLKSPEPQSDGDDQLGYRKIITRLPFHKKTVPLPSRLMAPHSFKHVMITTDNLIFVDDEDEDNVVLAILSF